MTLRYAKRVTLWKSEDAQLTLNLRLGIPSVSFRWKGITWNTRRGFSSVRLGNGLSWRDRD